jgi:hypothetical protein
MKDVLAIRDLHYWLARQLIELLQTDAAILVLGSLRIEDIWLQECQI